MKRLIDISLALCGLAVVWPVLLVVALLIRISMGAPVFFVQMRPGLDGRPFRMVKFRTMVAACEDKCHYGTEANRITRLGRVLRASSLDELPELWNVVKGDMSIVGPRPLRMEYLPLYSREQARRHNVRPGVTGWAQINGRNSLSWEDKFAFDVWYVDNRNLWLDFKIMLLTVKRVIWRSDINLSDNVTAERFVGSRERASK